MKAGIIGGLGPASTYDYYKGIIEGYRAAIGEDVYPEVLISSVNMSAFLPLIGSGHYDEAADFLAKETDGLKAAGADFVAIASNTPHIVYDRFIGRISLPCISIVDETCKYLKKNGMKRVAVFGTKFTMESGLYDKALPAYGLEAKKLSAQAAAMIHSIIFPNLENGIVIPEDKARLIALANSEGADCDAIILGCTELPLILQDGDCKLPLANTTQIHIEAIVKKLLER